MLYQNGKTVAISQTSASSAFSQDIYSTEEQVVGQWIDGKPLYKKTWIGKTSSEGNVWTETGIVIDDLDTLVDFRAIGTANSSDSNIVLPYYETESSYANLSYWRGHNGKYGFCTYCYHSSGKYFYAMPFYVTAWYTKTTDEQTIEVDQFSQFEVNLSKYFDTSTPITTITTSYNEL